MRDRSWIQWLRSWPLLIGAIVAFAFGVYLAKDDEHRLFAAFALVTIGSILIGGWIVLLSSHGYSGSDPPQPPDDSGNDDRPDP